MSFDTALEMIRKRKREEPVGDDDDNDATITQLDGADGIDSEEEPKCDKCGSLEVWRCGSAMWKCNKCGNKLGLSCDKLRLSFAKLRYASLASCHPSL